MLPQRVCQRREEALEKRQMRAPLRLILIAICCQERGVAAIPIFSGLPTVSNRPIRYSHVPDNRGQDHTGPHVWNKGAQDRTTSEKGGKG